MTWLAALGMVLGAAPAQDETVGVRLREWFAIIEGHVQGQGESVPSEDLDLEDDLGIDDREGVHEIQGYLSLPLVGRFYAGWWGGHYEGDRTVSQTFTYADRTFTVSTDIHTEIDLNVYYVSYEFLLPTIPLGDLLQFQAGLLVGLRAIQAEGSIEGGGSSGSEQGGGGLPLVGGHVGLQVTPYLRADVEVMGLVFKYDDTSLSYFEAFGEVVGQLGPLFAGAGYKFVDLILTDHRSGVDLDLDVGLSGFYVTAGLRF